MFLKPFRSSKKIYPDLRLAYSCRKFLRFDNPVNSSVLARTRSELAVFASCSAKLILINARAIVIKAGRSMNSGKYPGFRATIPSSEALATSEMVAL